MIAAQSLMTSNICRGGIGFLPVHAFRWYMASIKKDLGAALLRRPK
jgi:hypothetical protein